MEGIVLIIDDDVKLQKLLKEYLQGYGFKIISLLSGADAMTTIQNKYPDIIILDIVMPGQDGLEVLRNIRKSYTTPVIMLSAKGEETDRIIGLEVGADDYLPKPFNPRELLARMKAVLRRPKPGQASVDVIEKQGMSVKAGGMELDRFMQSLIRKDKVVELTSTEYGILEALMVRPNTVFSRGQLMNHVRGKDFSAFDRSIDMHISKIRAKIKTVSNERNLIKTVWSTGYMFVTDS